MRYLSLSLMLAVASSAVAQTFTLPTLAGGANGGNVGGGVYFDLQVNTTITLTSIDFRTGGATLAGTNAFVDLWLGPSTYLNNIYTAGLWTKVGSTAPTTVIAGQQLVTNQTIIPVPQIAAVTLAPGTYGFALKSNNHSHGYTNGLTCTSSTVPGSCSNSSFSTAHLTLRGGAAQNAFLQALPAGTAFSPRIFNGALTYTLGGTPITFAQRESYGKGCYSRYRSFYEFWPSSVSVDLSNTSMLLTYNAGNNTYSATAGTTPVLAPVSANLAMLDDENRVIPLANGQPIIYPGVGGPGLALTQVEMCSNGYINLNGTNPVGTGNPTVAAFLGGTPIIGNWHDMDPSVAPGSTHYDFDVASSTHVFTWLNCNDATIAASPNTFQMAFFANGNVELRWGVMSQAGGGGWPTLVGFSPGLPSLDPTSRDISLSLPFSTDSTDQNALALAGDVNPVIGSTVNLTTSNQTGLNLGLTFVCLADLAPFSPVGLDLAVIQAPGCVANVDINQGVGNVISNLGLPGLSMTVGFPIPNQVSIVGGSFFCQSVWLDTTQNAGGLITSNALRLRVGSF